MKEKLIKLWNDPVWSNVIAAIMIALGSSLIITVIALIKSLVNKVSFKFVFSQIINYFKSTIEINNLIFWLIILFLLVILISFIKSLILINKNKEKEEEVEEEAIVFPPNLPDIACNSTVFFSQRLSDSFPGQRGVKTYSGKIAVKRLQLLLTEPLIFNPISEDSMAKPIWWFRGTSSLYIESFKKLSKTKILINHRELVIKKIVVVVKELYIHSYIYVETKAEKQIGLHNLSKKDIKNRILDFGYCHEEYGLYKRKPITRQEFDDGSAVIRKKVVDTRSAELRVRFLSDYNFIIAAKQSPYIFNEFESFSETRLNSILADNYSIETLIKDIDEFLHEYRR